MKRGEDNEVVQNFFNKICGKVLRKRVITSAAWGYVSVEHATHAAFFSEVLSVKF
jgi:hypothetical protein